MPRCISLCLILLTALLALGANSPTKLTGKVVGVKDGDTIRVCTDTVTIKVRLYGIDAPESGQPFGKASKKCTSELVFGKQRLYFYAYLAILIANSCQHCYEEFKGTLSIEI